MIKVANGACIRRLGFRAMRASRARNLIAVLAIALTTVLFTALFTIAASINYSYQQENFRQAGGDCHGSIKDLLPEQTDELRDDPIIRESLTRLFVGMPSDPPFNKSHVEVSYIEPNGAHHYFCTPKEGSLPHEGTDEAATDTNVLSLLGVKPEIGAKFTVSFYIDENTSDKQLVTRTFTLSGWWDYDSAILANNILLPRSAAEEICAMGNGDKLSMTGKWNLDVMFKNSMNIRENLLAVLKNHGYQNDDATQDNFLKIGVNWGYTGSKFSENIDPTTMLVVIVLLLLIVFTGYLIIYNVFQISVINDIRFYGLLKTIGTTGVQIKRIIRQQAFLLSAAGIPPGLMAGFLIGNKLTPVVIAQTSYNYVFVTFNPLIFIGAALFALATIFLSCARPGRIAAGVSPIEAVRYTEGNEQSGGKRKQKHGQGKRIQTRGSGKDGASLIQMAWANLSRNKSRTVITVISLTLAVVLMTLTYTFASGFDMDKYLQTRANVDFILGHAGYFQTTQGFCSADEELPENIIADVNTRGGIQENGRIYGRVSGMKTFVAENFFRAKYGRWAATETVQAMVDSAERNDNGLLADSVELYGMEDFPLSLMEIIEGDIAPLYDRDSNAVAAVYETDDYHAPHWDSNQARVGDKITVRYISEMEYYWTDTGEPVDDFDALSDPSLERGFASRSTVYEDREYTVCALIVVPYNLSYRHTGPEAFVLNAERFCADTGTDSVMAYIFNTHDESEEAMEDFLSQYTESVQPLYDYESRRSYQAEFDGFRNMFLVMGGALSFIIGLVGVLNFINAILTGILTRKREFAVLQSVGMTSPQLKTMLVYEGLYYTLLSLAVSLVMTVVLGPLVGKATGNVFWFFTYHMTVTPLIAVLPIFLLLGVLVPLGTYRSVAKRTIVERLREAEG